MPLYAQIIFLYFKKKLTIREIASMFSIQLKDYEDFGSGLSDIEKVQRIVGNEYREISRIKYNDAVSDYTPVNGRSIKVVNTDTNVVYKSIKEAAEYNYIPTNTLRSILNGHTPNHTPLAKYTETKISENI
jgi:hypothetical protein